MSELKYYESKVADGIQHPEVCYPYYHQETQSFNPPVWLWFRWTAHCQAILHKANKTLEYGSEAWNPFHTTAVQRLDKVQRAAARFVHQDYRRDTSATALISRLGWDPLHTRRLLAQCTMFYKIHYNFVGITVPPFIIPATYISRHDHKLKYVNSSKKVWKSEFDRFFLRSLSNNLCMFDTMRETIKFSLKWYSTCYDYFIRERAVFRNMG